MSAICENPDKTLTFRCQSSATATLVRVAARSSSSASATATEGNGPPRSRAAHRWLHMELSTRQVEMQYRTAAVPGCGQ